MSGEIKYPAQEMFWLALEIMGLITDVCDRLHIAGSLRRCKQEVGDIELVMTPRYAGDINLLETRCDDLLRCKVVEKRLNKNGHAIAWGKANESSRYKAVLYKGVPVDLFIVLPDRQWGPTMVLRTGPGLANGVLVTTDGIRNRDDNVGILPDGMAFNEGAVWRGLTRLDTPEETDVFAALGLPYIPPHERSVEEYHLWARRRPFKTRAGYQPTFYHEFNWTAQPTWEGAALPKSAEQGALL